MFFYLLNRNKTVYDLRKAASFTMQELSDRSGIESAILKKYEQHVFKDLPKKIRHDLSAVLQNEIGF